MASSGIALVSREADQLPDMPAACSDITSANKIQLLGLDAVQQRLGEKWTRMADLVHRYFEAAMKREMRHGDSFIRSGDTSYLLLFRDVSIAEAQMKCRAIAQEVCHKLFGDDGDLIAARSLSLPVQGLAIRDPLALDRLLERDGREQHINSGETFAAPPALDVISACDDREHKLNLLKPHFVYRPIWDAIRGAVLTYLCQPLPDTISLATQISGVVTVSPQHHDAGVQMVAMDILVLSECLHRAKHMQASGTRAVLIAPIHFSTLSRGRYWELYHRALAGQDACLLKDIGFMVHDISADVPNTTLCKELPKLRTLSSHIFCLVDHVQNISVQFRNTGVRGVGMAVRPSHQSPEFLDRFQKLSHGAKLIGMECFSLGLSQRSYAVNMIGVGVRYLEGSVIRRPMTEPRAAFRNTVDSLYAHEMAS